MVLDEEQREAKRGELRRLRQRKAVGLETRKGHVCMSTSQTVRSKENTVCEHCMITERRPTQAHGEVHVRGRNDGFE